MLGGASYCCGGAPVGERITLMGSVILLPSYVVLPAKNKNRNGAFDQGCEGGLILKKSSLSG